uniref:Uncharacterized protein n=1 Tax=Trichuris muris TaxID=70415 RepID=A0A5S6QMN5_TRIMR
MPRTVLDFLGSFVRRCIVPLVTSAADRWSALLNCLRELRCLIRSMDAAARRKVDVDLEGDEKRLISLNKMFQTWLKEPSKEGLRLLKIQLLQCKNGMLRATLMSRAIQERTDALAKESESFSEDMAGREQLLQQRLQEMNEARRQRNNKREYDLIAGMIRKYPDQSTAKRKSDQLRTEIEEVKKANLALKSQLEMRKKHMHVIAMSLREFKRSFDQK